MKDVRFWKVISSLFVLGVVLVFFVQVWNILIPFFLGLVIAYLVTPLVDRFTAMGLKRSRIVIVLYLLLMSVAVVLGIWLIPTLFREANQAINEIPTYAKSLDGMVDNINAGIQKYLTPILGRRAEAIAIPLRVHKLVESLFFTMPQNLLSVAHVGLWIIIIPFVSFFALSDGKRWIDILFDLTPSEYVESLLGLLADLNATLGGYVRGVLLESTIVFFLTMIGLLFMGVQGAVLLGFVTGLVNFIPFMAPLIGGSMALLVAFFQGKSVAILLGIIVLFVLIRLLDDFVLIPFVVGHSVRLHPIITLFAILAGIELGGFLGLLFAIPAAVVIKVVLSVAMRNKRERLMLRHQQVYS